MDSLTKECKGKLLQLRAQLINDVTAAKREFSTLDTQGGDEADQSMLLLAENEFLTRQQRMKELLVEVNFALARIDSGRFGICEETEEPIEAERLRALPWTRFSIEGAELKEAIKKRYART